MLQKIAASWDSTELISHSCLFNMYGKTIGDDLCHRLFHSYQDLALQEVEKISN